MSGNPGWHNVVLQAALAYAARGWRVFPCDPRVEKPYSKRPLVVADKDENDKPIKGSGWPKKASTDPLVIRAWWKRWPDALIGMAPAWADGFVVDIDTKGEPVDVVERRLEEAIGGPLPEGPRTITQSGGRHCWFERPAGTGVYGNSKLGLTNLDIRCDNGYVILPPSIMRDGKTYEWETPYLGKAPPVPPKLLQLLADSKDKAKPADGPEGAAPPKLRAPAASPGDEARRRYARAALDGIARDAAAALPGHRGTDLYAAAARAGRFLAANVLSEREVMAALQDAAEACGLVKDDGLAHVLYEIRRGLKTGQGDAAEVIAQLADIGREAERKAAQRGAGPAPPPGGPEDYGLPAATPQPPAGEAAGGGSGGSKTPPPGGDDFDPERIAACARLEQNDADNGQRLIKHFGHLFVQVRDVGVHVWTGTHWELEGGQEALERFAHRTAKAIAREALLIEPSKNDKKLLELAELLKARPVGELTPEELAILRDGMTAEARTTKRRGDRRKFSISCGNRARTVAMIAQALPHKTITQDRLDADLVAINCLNGVLRAKWVQDLECPDPEIVRKIWSIEFKEGHDPADLMSKRMEFAYDPDAKCPRFEKFMARFQPSDDVRWYIQKSHGYACTGLTAVQALNFHYGGGSNGKSVFITTIAGVMGSYATLIPFTSLVNEQQRRSDQANPDIIRLPRVRMVHAAEPPKGVSWDEALVKQLTGGEPMLARALFQGFIEFKPLFKMAVFGNEKPGVNGLDHGIWRRLRIVPWNVTISEVESRDLADVVAEMLEEGPGILNWLLAGLRGYFAGGLRPPDAVIEATKEYRDENDPVGPFIRAHVEISPGESVAARELYHAYVAWAQANGVTPIKETRFGRVMPQKGFRKNDERVRHYLDIRLHDVPEHREDPRSPKTGGDDLF